MMQMCRCTLSFKICGVQIQCGIDRASLKGKAARQARAAPTAQASGGVAISANAQPRQSSEVGTRTANGVTIEQLPLPEGEHWDTVVGETAELQANHFEWAHKRHAPNCSHSCPGLQAHVCALQQPKWLTCSAG